MSGVFNWRMTIAAASSEVRNGRRSAAAYNHRKRCAVPAGSRLSAGWMNWNARRPLRSKTGIVRRPTWLSAFCCRPMVSSPVARFTHQAICGSNAQKLLCLLREKHRYVPHRRARMQVHQAGIRPRHASEVQRAEHIAGDALR